MPTGGSGTGQLQDATIQAAIALFGGVVPSGGSGTGQAQDASFQALLLLLGGGVLPGGGFFIRIPVALVNVSSVANVLAGTVVTRAYFDNSAASGGVAYTAGTTITLGTAANPTLFMGAADSNPTVQGLYDKLQDTANAVTDPLLVTIAGAPAVGSGFACVEFTKPLV